MDLLAINISLPRRTFDLRVELTLAVETLAVVGPSGAGKSSLLRAVAGLEHAHGTIALGDELWLDRDRRINLAPERRRVGYLPQDYALFPHLSVAGNVRFAGHRERPDLLERLGIAHLAAARPGQLSGGERQRVALARALARDPAVLALDEPMSALDPQARRHVRDQLADVLKDLGLPTLLVTHAFDDAAILADRIGVMDHGAIVQIGSGQELVRRPATVTVAALTGANVLDAVATPKGSGAQLALAGGGQLSSADPAEGPVSVAVHPWALELADPGDAGVVETVLGVREDRGITEIRTPRFILQQSSRQDGGRTPPADGSVVGLRAAPDDVHVFPAA
jgi:molybdate transport system ATP-binding protein